MNFKFKFKVKRRVHAVRKRKTFQIFKLIWWAWLTWINENNENLICVIRRVEREMIAQQDEVKDDKGADQER